MSVEIVQLLLHSFDSFARARHVAGLVKGPPDANEARRLKAEADGLQEQRRFAEAVTAYRQALAADPFAVDAYNALGVAHQALAQAAEAERAFRSAIELAPDLASAVDALRNLIEGAARIVPLTGAGISTECGIPDFRSPGGLWTKNKPIPFDEFLANQDMRNEAWRRRFAMDAQFSAARPGRGHLALASLYRGGKAPAVITQNIDNLHQSSGI